MSTTQLRVYQLPADRAEQDAWVEWWKGLAGARAAYGFEIVSAVLDRETAVFTWMVRVDGDGAAFDAAEQAYMVSPERAEKFALPKPAITQLRIAKVDVFK
jgi:pyruvate/2-oxoacid:ferredoxin oxidoreductase beta subunit